jgi:hypothetical protein
LDLYAKDKPKNGKPEYVTIAIENIQSIR